MACGQERCGGSVMDGWFVQKERQGAGGQTGGFFSGDDGVPGDEKGNVGAGPIVPQGSRSRLDVHLRVIERYGSSTCEANPGGISSGDAELCRRAHDSGALTPPQHVMLIRILDRRDAQPLLVRESVENVMNILRRRQEKTGLKSTHPRPTTEASEMRLPRHPWTLREGGPGW